MYHRIVDFEQLPKIALGEPRIFSHLAQKGSKGVIALGVLGAWATCCHSRSKAYTACAASLAADWEGRNADGRDANYGP